MAKRIGILLLCVLAAAVIVLIAFAEKPQVVTGEAQGYGGMITATVTLDDGKITNVELSAPDETPGVGTRAIEALPARMAEAGNADVEVVSGATVTSRGVIQAVKNAMGQSSAPESTGSPSTSGDALRFGFGLSNTGRVGPGEDETGTSVYSINQPFAAVLFDQEDRVRFLYVDQVEVSTPNYDGESMPNFSGFPGQRYNLDEQHDGKIAGQLAVTDASFLEEASGFKTKRERGESYMLGSGTWSAEMDAYQALFVGKTIDEIEDWVARYTSDRNGRPLKADSGDADDKAKYDALSDEEKGALSDVVSGATMSLNDAHGDILKAIRAAFDARRDVSGEVHSVGLALLSSGSVGGQDDSGKPTFTLNEVFAAACFDADGRVVASHIDQLEIASDNAAGSAPKFSGYPGQAPLSKDVTEITDDSFVDQVSAFQTKRQRGESYRMPAGSWASQMDAYQAQFQGKTLDELTGWFSTHFGEDGKPLRQDTEGAQEQYNALDTEEKNALADLVTRASMSLKSAQNDLLGALQKAYDSRVPIGT